MSATNKALSKRLLDEAFNAGNLGVMDEILTDGFVNYDAALPEPTTGIEAAKASVTGYRDAFPDLKITIEEQIVGTEPQRAPLVPGPGARGREIEAVLRGPGIDGRRVGRAG